MRNETRNNRHKRRTKAAVRCNVHTLVHGPAARKSTTGKYRGAAGTRWCSVQSCGSVVTLNG